MRDRLRRDAVGKPMLTNSTDLSLWEYEAPILEEAVEKYKFAHWASHLISVQSRMSGSRLYLVGGDRPEKGDFKRLRDVIAESLLNAEFAGFSDQVANAPDEQSLNSTIIHQYTIESDLYAAVNSLLRRAHAGEGIGSHALIPWILQFNCAIHLQPAASQTVYRGMELSNDDLYHYELGNLFVWGPFVSTSLSKEKCLGGNVLFSISPSGALDNHEKRDPRAIWMHSKFPDEEEAVFPFCCAFRVKEIKRPTGAAPTYIALDCMDSW